MWNALRRLNAWGAKHPRALGSISGAGLGGAGDLASQRLERAERADIWRSSLVSLWYASSAWFFWAPFLAWQARAFGESGLASLACKVATFNAAVATFDITGFHLVAMAPRVGLDEALRALREGYFQTVAVGWSLWTPGMAVVYRVMPPHLQMPSAYTLDVLWACALSYMSNTAREAGRSS